MRRKQAPARRRSAQQNQRFFCETHYAGPLAPWHIRPAGPKGRCPGGGADTEALCGREVAWDINLEVTPQVATEVGPCPRCLAAYAPGEEG